MRAQVRLLIVNDDFEFRYAIADGLRPLDWEVRGRPMVPMPWEHCVSGVRM